MCVCVCVCAWVCLPTWDEVKAHACEQCLDVGVPLYRLDRENLAVADMKHAGLAQPNEADAPRILSMQVLRNKLLRKWVRV